jgi:hypothetical protein
MITTPVYVTRDLIATSTDVKSSARNNDLIDMVAQSASRQVERETHRRFYPETATRKWDWPNYDLSDSWQLWLDDDEAISLSSLTSGGTTIDASAYILRRSDGKQEPPYDQIQLLLSGSASFSGGSTFQQSIVGVGVFGAAPELTVPQGALGANITGSATTLSASDSTIGVGALLYLGTERLLVQDKAMVDTTQNLTNTLTANPGNTIVGVGAGSTFSRGEIILIGGEKMRVDEIAGNNLIVTRAWDGTVLATHAINDDVYALRTFTVSRGFLGSTAASHSQSDVISVWYPPALITDYALALALNDKRMAIVGYQPDLVANKALADKKEAVYASYARKGRSGAV